jgi:hypothetical protein
MYSFWSVRYHYLPSALIASVRRACSERSASVQRAFGYAVHKLPSALIASVGRALGERSASVRPAFGVRSASVRRAFRYTVLYSLWFAF